MRQPGGKRELEQMEAATQETPQTTSRLFDNRHFRNLIIGGTISMFGDQFYLVALPWLVLQLTGSSVVLGTTLMLAAIPRTVLMLIGGAMSDRTSARQMMLFTSCSRTVLVAAVAALIWANLIALWHLYILAFAFGIADAFAIPALSAMIPALVERHQLTKANSVLQSSMQLTLILGPAPAGAIMKMFGSMWAFFIDAISFLFIIGALWTIPDPPKREQQQSAKGVWHTLTEGLKYVYADTAMRTLILFSTALNFCIMGPLMVGLAVLAKKQFGSAAAYGATFSAFAAGALAGSIIAGSRKQRKRGAMLLFLGGSLGILLAMVGLLHTLFSVCVVMCLMGLFSGYSNIHMTAWYQERVEPSMMGRVMSLRMFAIFGTMPVTLAIAGFIADSSLKLLFIVSGGIMFLVTIFASTQRAVRQVD